MNCDQARTEIIAYLKGELSPEQKKRLEEHFARCPNCRHELEGARRLLSWTESASQETIVKKVEEIIDSAILAGASDIHLEPQRDNTLLVRQRVDGVLHEFAHLDSVQRYGVMTRIKMMADMNVSETSIPQDGRLPWQMGEDPKKYDLRVSAVPFVHGEGAVMRILDQSNVLIGLDRLSLGDEHLDTLRHLISQPNGLIVLSGPTGSGKTTTAYSVLHALNSPEQKILTVEDPVEYVLTGVNQVHVNKKAGLTFTSALRAFLRHDPDIIFAGETRDQETAVILTQAALTGHLVLTILHTQDALGVVERLLDLVGNTPYIVGATLIGVISQRLARRVCKDCAEEVQVSADDPLMQFLGITADDLREAHIMRGKGCETCRSTGYKGRLALYEILQIDRDLRGIISDGAAIDEIEKAALASGFRRIREDAKAKVLAGLTTPEEACRVLAYSA